MSVDGSREVAAQYAACDTHIRIVENPRSFAPLWMNLGIREAMGDVISEEVLRSWHPVE